MLALARPDPGFRGAEAMIAASGYTLQVSRREGRGYAHHSTVELGAGWTEAVLVAQEYEQRFQPPEFLVQLLYWETKVQQVAIPSARPLPPAEIPVFVEPQRDQALVDVQPIREVIDAAPAKKRRGFAAMPIEQRRAISAKGGRAAHAVGHAHEFTPTEASAAVKKRRQPPF